MLVKINEFPIELNKICTQDGEAAANISASHKKIDFSLVESFKSLCVNNYGMLDCDESEGSSEEEEELWESDEESDDFGSGEIYNWIFDIRILRDIISNNTVCSL